MPKTAINKQKPAGPFDRFLGSDARIAGGGEVISSNHVQVQSLMVSFATEDQPEETGKLYLYPMGDNSFSLQLCYLFYTSGDAEYATVYSVLFLPAFFEQFPAESLMASQPFRLDKATEQQFTIGAQSLTLLDQLNQGDRLDPFAALLHQTQSVISLLSRALENITIPFTADQVPACRFLAFETEREKIQEACAIIARSEGRPHTIRELSRKVAMNECYLKKGFKAITGKTIHEYQQELRIEKAKQLLQTQGLSVTDVASELGYSSISHFSTAFKRVTGMKPCELIA